MTISKQNPIDLSLNEALQITQHQEFSQIFLSSDINDKLVVKLFTSKDGEKSQSLKYVGMIKLKETFGLKFGNNYETIIQLGPEALEIVLNFEDRKSDDHALKPEGSVSEFKEPEPANLTFKDKVFFDVLDLMEFKIHKITQKNTLTKIQIKKIQTRNELIKKQIFELEHSNPITEFDNLVQSSALKSKRLGNSQSVKKIDSSEMTPRIEICGCGNGNPKFRGFCENCVKRLKEQYERVLQ